MRVLLVANYAPDGQESMQRYARVLAAGLAAAGDEVRVIRPAVAAGGVAGGEVGKWLGHADKWLLFPRALRRAAREADVVHVCDHSNAPYLGEVRDRPALITCHDVIAIASALGRVAGHRTRATGRVLQRWILKWLRRARRVVCVSPETRAQLVALAPELAERTATIPNALDPAFRPMSAEERARRLAGRRLPPRFLLHVGGRQFYKNRNGALAIFAALARRPGWDADLVLAGPPVDEGLAAQACELGVAARIHALTSPTDDELAALYGSAVALLFPSLMEGFGWPIAEAQACGCPVITSDRAPMSETAGGAAVLVAPERPDEAAERVEAGLRDAERLRAAGFENAKRFDRSLFVERYRAVYREVLG